MKCAIIGCGRNAEDMIVPSLRALDVKIQAVCDVNIHRAKDFSEKCAAAVCFDKVENLLAASKDLDFVVVSTPGFTHFEICKKLLERGIHTLVEKPVTTELQDTIALRQMAKAKGVKLGVMQNYRYREPVMAAKKAQAAGIIGEVKQFNAVFHGQAIFNEPTPWSWNERENKVLLFEMMIHLLDLQVYFAGPVKRIIACHKKVDEILKTTTNIYALVEHSNLAVGIVDFQLFSSSNYIGFEVFGSANDVRIKLQPHYLRIYSGTVNPLDELYYDFKRIWDFGMLTMKNKLAGSRKAACVGRKAQSHFELIRRFVESMRSGEPFEVDIDQVIPTMEYAEMLSLQVYGTPDQPSCVTPL